MQLHPTVTKDEWIEARRALLAKKKELTQLRERIAEERRALPWVKIEKPYVFDGPAGPVTLAELFDGRSQLYVKHFMMGPGAVTQCVGCSFEVDHVEGILSHLNNHDVTYAVVARIASPCSLANARSVSLQCRADSSSRRGVRRRRIST